MAQTKPDCNSVIAACDKALAEKNKQIELQDIGLKTCTEQLGAARVENIELTESAHAWYKNPVVMFVFGAAAGTLTYVLLKN